MIEQIDVMAVVKVEGAPVQIIRQLVHVHPDSDGATAEIATTARLVRWDGNGKPLGTRELVTTGSAPQRCSSCEHEIGFHTENGCWFAVEVGRKDKPIGCACAVSRDVLVAGS